MSDLQKRPDQKEGEVAFQQETLALLNRRLVEYQAALRRTQQQQARTALIRTRIESGALNAARAPGYIVEADSVVEAAKASGPSRLRDALLNPEHREAALQRVRPETLAEWRTKLAQEQRSGPNIKRRLAK